MSPLDVAALAFAVCVAAAIQTSVGFGFGLLLVPALLAMGRGLPETLALVLGASLWQTTLGLVSVRHAIRWRETVPLAVAQWLALPVGILLMHAMEAAGTDRVKQGVGATLMAVLTTRLLVNPTPRDHVPRALAWSAAAVSGVLSGAVGMGGPPLVLLALAERREPDRYRAFLWEQYVLLTPMLLVALVVARGPAMLTAFASGLALAPALFVGVRLGRSIGARWDVVTLSRAAIAMLYLLAITSVVAPLVP